MAKTKVPKPALNNHTENHSSSAGKSNKAEPERGGQPGSGDNNSLHTLEATGHSAKLAGNAGNGSHAPAEKNPEVSEKVKELVRLAQEQGYLTYNDINESLPENLSAPEHIEEVLLQLRNLDVEIVDPAEVDRIKQAEPEEEDEKTRLDILDDPVRMYLKQMGQVPLLTREQEVEISKRIEEAENEVKRTVYSYGFAAKEHIALAENFN